MSNDEINKYKELYSQLVTNFAGLHNANQLFIVTQGREPGFALRKCLREVEDLAKQLKRQSQLVNKEVMANKRLAKQRAREEKKNKKKKKKDVVL